MIPELQIKGEIQLRFAAEDVRRSQVIAFLDKSRLLVEQTRDRQDRASVIDLSYLSQKKDGPSALWFSGQN
jgi:hypothetical protein